MSENKLYELRVDVTTPAGYWRAGTKLTKKGWIEQFGDFRIEWKREWFIDLEEQNIVIERDSLQELINAVFKRKQLSSLSYKDAAREIAELWLKQNQQNAKSKI
jgi:hypothetical protein